MGKQPAIAVELDALNFVALVVLVEQLPQGHVREVIDLLGAVLRRAADREAAVRLKLDGAVEFGERLDIPIGIGGREALQHKVMDIFVLQNAAGVKLGALVAFPRLHRPDVARFSPGRGEGNSAAGAGDVEAANAGPGAARHGRHVLDSAEAKDRHLVRSADRLGRTDRKALKRPQSIVEAFELNRELLSGALPVLRIDDEMVRFGAPPFGASRCRQQHEQQRQDHANHRFSPLPT
jgi:hypothetical protein